MITIYHNGECTKSKGALEILIEEHIPHEVRYYMIVPLSKPELQRLLDKLQLPAFDIVRTYEPLFAERFEGKELSDEEWIDTLLEFPELMQRPIVETDVAAFVARPAERVLELK